MSLVGTHALFASLNWESKKQLEAHVIVKDGINEKHFGITITATPETGDVTAFTLKETYTTYASITNFGGSNLKAVAAKIRLANVGDQIIFDFGDGTKIYGNLDRVTDGKGKKSTIEFEGTGNWETQGT